MRFVFIACLFVLFVFSNSVPQEIINGFFPGHSGSYIVAPEQIGKGDAFFVTKTGASYNGQDIKETNFGDFLAHVFGLPPFSFDTSRSSFPFLNLFEKTRALVFIAIDGVGKENVNNQNWKLLKETTPISISKESYPSDSVAFLTTLVSGVSPSKHGIVGRNWINHGEEVNAYLGNAQSQAANLADILSQTYEGRSLTLCFGSDQQLASALSVHKAQLLYHPFWNNYVYFWDEKSAMTESISPVSRLESELLFSKKQVLEDILPSISDKFKISLQEKGDKKVVISSASDSATFDLDSQDLSLFVELKQLRMVESELTRNSRIQTLALDQIPDFISFVSSSVSILREKYGDDSAQVRIASSLLDVAIDHFVGIINRIYEEESTSHIVFLGGSALSTFKRQVAQLLSELQLPAAALATVQKVLPYFYFQPTTVSFPETMKLYKHEVPVADKTETNRPKRNVVTTGDDSNSDDLTYFQICLWLTITLAIVLFVIILAMFMLPNERDTLLYSSTPELK